MSAAMKVGAFVLAFGAVLILFAGDHRVPVPDELAEVEQLEPVAA
jgi:hypothetical protein